MGPWGFEGEVRIQAETDNPRRFSRGSRLLANGQILRVERCRWHKGFALLKLRGIDTWEDAQHLQGASLEVPVEEMEPLAPDSYYHFQVLDMEVRTREGEYLGRVESILATGSNDVYVVRGEEGEILVPALKDVVVDVDTQEGRMTVDLPEGLR
ncbi:MAG: rRNA processing protein RimM [Dehalococcoidia bacterium]|nr:rRNA processing protein RimM [Dehalococcoidia bacterium]